MPPASATPMTPMGISCSGSQACICSKQHNARTGISRQDYLRVTVAAFPEATLTSLPSRDGYFLTRMKHPCLQVGRRFVLNMASELYTRCMLVFVAPPKMESGFTRQTLSPCSTQWSEDTPQYVMSLSDAELFIPNLPSAS